MKSWKKISVGVEEISVPEKLHEISGRRSGAAALMSHPSLPSSLPPSPLPREASAAATAGFMQKVSTKTKWPAAAVAERRESPRDRK